MKFFLVCVFLCLFLVFVQSFPLEDNAEFEVHNDGVEIQGTGDELMPQVRNKRQFNWMRGSTALGALVNYDIPRGGASVINSIKDFAPHGGTRVGVEGSLNLMPDKTQTLTLSAGHSTNIGPGSKMPESTIGLTYSKTFK